MKPPIYVINPNSSEAVTAGIDAAMAPLRMAGGPVIRCLTLAEGPPGIVTHLDVQSVAQPLALRADALAGALERIVLHVGDRVQAGDVIVIANFADRSIDDLRIGVPAAGRWRVRFNSDAPNYARDFGGHEAFDTEADGAPADGLEHSTLVAVGPYSVVVLSQDD